MGQFVETKVHSAKGRADAVVKTQDHIYVFEFKLQGSAKEHRTVYRGIKVALIRTTRTKRYIKPVSHSPQITGSLKKEKNGMRYGVVGK